MMGKTSIFAVTEIGRTPLTGPLSEVMFSFVSIGKPLSAVA